MKATFLHISDLHYRPNWPEQTGLVFSKFIEDLETQIPLYENLFVVFSGDLVWAAAEDGLYEAFQKDVAAPLDRLGLTHEKRICIPGNHDVSRAALKANIRTARGALSNFKDEESFLSELPELSKMFFQPKFEAYSAAEKRFAGQTCCQSSVGGAGWELPGNIGVYCLNTSLCSFAGMDDPQTGTKISDERMLGIDTRSLYQWEQQSPSTSKILVMHHPLEWLTDWARTELENVIAEKFDLILFGHLHRANATFLLQGERGSVFCMAPPLFTRKADPLGYAFVTIDTDIGSVEIAYRQWIESRKFVLGTSLAGNDRGSRKFEHQARVLPSVSTAVGTSPKVGTEALLEAEFNEASTCYSSKRQIWVARDLARQSETHNSRDLNESDPIESLAHRPRSSVVRAPKEFGLTCLGRQIALEHFRINRGSKILAMCDTCEIAAHRQGVISYVKVRCASLEMPIASLAGIILDNWENDQKSHKILNILRNEFPGVPLLILQGFDDFNDIHQPTVLTNDDGFEILYLRSLTRSRIRELVHTYLEYSESTLDEDLVTKKVISDIDGLNIHRTPVNCLLLLKLIDRAFDDSPVNRTEMIGNVLFSLFHEFDQIPKYSVRPDLKDCGFALGYLCEWMIRNNRRSFTKGEFTQKVNEYCKKQWIEFDVEILFNFLFSENIFIRRGIEFGFRLAYWLFYFSAQRMHHNAVFGKYILTDCRYSAFPEIIEFYTGIDRMRTDAVLQLTQDLRRMDHEFLFRTQIAPDFNPLGQAQWNPGEESIARMKQEVADSIQESALPPEVKDAVADGSYDRSKPYHQEIAQFITKSSLAQMVQAMKGAARALRNSDHVDPTAKAELLDAVINCWIRMSQILVLLSPVLATNGKAQFDGMGFFLDQSFEEPKEPNRLWDMIMTAVADNVVSWYQIDIFSKKLGSLFKHYLGNNSKSLGELLVLLLIIRQRPLGWNKTVEEFIMNSSKHSFYLNRVYVTLLDEFRVGFANESTRQQLRTLAAMAAAKHWRRVMHPNQKVIAEVAKAIDADIATRKSDSSINLPGQMEKTTDTDIALPSMEEACPSLPDDPEDGSSTGNHFPHLSIFPWFQCLQIDSHATTGKSVHCITHHRQPSLRKNVHFDQSDRFNCIHVQMRGWIALGTDECRCQRMDGITRDHHTTGMHFRIPWKPVQKRGHFQCRFIRLFLPRAVLALLALLHGVRQVLCAGMRHILCEASYLVISHTQDLCNISHGRSATERVKPTHNRCMLMAVTPEDQIHDIILFVVRKVDVDVRQLV